MGKRVGIFGGSFDPVHNGHIHIVKSFLSSGLLDEILVLLTPDPPHKDLHAQAEFEDRFNMLKLAFSGLDNVRISDLETRLPKPSYTLQTVEYLQQKNPENTWYLCMGEDSLATFHTWHRYRDILNKVTLLAAERPGFSHPETAPEVLEKTIIVKHTPVKISSSDIRLKGRNDSLPSLPEPVAAYIRQHQLY
ncbi:MAG: nicotinate (nicotinamide) nucleotide adenylyltransferase [Balneolaceae bacterium]